MRWCWQLAFVVADLIDSLLTFAIRLGALVVSFEA